jgi:hypothetical protein
MKFFVGWCEQLCANLGVFAPLDDRDLHIGEQGGSASGLPWYWTTLGQMVRCSV